jgi:PilZ domain-containing protein
MGQPIPIKSMDERRASSRQRRLHGAKIVFNDGSSSIDCVVRDLSTNGARLDVVSPIGIPEWFDLRINRNGACYPSKVAWRSGKQIGVTFIDI